MPHPSGVQGPPWRWSLRLTPPPSEKNGWPKGASHDCNEQDRCDRNERDPERHGQQHEGDRDSQDDDCDDGPNEGRSVPTPRRLGWQTSMKLGLWWIPVVVRCTPPPRSLARVRHDGIVVIHREWAVATTTGA